jgi:hypothetical protein
MGLGRRWVTGWALVAGLAGPTVIGVGTGGLALARDAPPEVRRNATETERRAARRRWAMAKMDEMANGALRCRERFSRPRQVQECEAEFTRRYREYNEIYLEAARD